MATKPKLMRVRIDRESWPQLLYSRVVITSNPQYLNIPIDPGFYFKLDRVNARWSNVNPNLAGAFALPPQIQIIRENQVLNIFPLDVSLMSSPGDVGVVVDMVNPARPMSAVPLNRSKALNMLYLFSQAINIRITNITVVGAADFSLPSHIDLVLMGRMHPAYSQENWGNG